MSAPTNFLPVEWPPGWHVQEVESTGSTNADLLAACEAGAPDRSVLRTAHQTAGRGRLDRRWDAPPGANLLVSLLFRDVPEHPGELTRRVGLAALEACRACAGATPILKWPNDLMLAIEGSAEAKLGGILAQRSPLGPVVVGLGLNVGWAPDGAARLGDAIEPRDVLVALLRAYDALPADIDADYRRHLGTLGRRVRMHLPAGDVVGTALDVEADGRLVVVDTCGVTHRLDVGDVVHLRPAEACPGSGEASQ